MRSKQIGQKSKQLCGCAASLKQKSVPSVEDNACFLAHIKSSHYTTVAAQNLLFQIFLKRVVTLIVIDFRCSKSVGIMPQKRKCIQFAVLDQCSGVIKNVPQQSECDKMKKTEKKKKPEYKAAGVRELVGSLYELLYS